MNILYLCDEYPPGRHGGIGTIVQLLAREMAKKGHHVIVAGFYVWGYGEEDEYIDEGVKVYRFRRGLDSELLRSPDSINRRILYKLFQKSGAFEWDIKRSLKKYRLFLEHLINKHKIDIIEMPDYNDYMRFCKTKVFFPRLSVPVIVKLHGSMTYIASELGMRVAKNIKEMEHALLMNAYKVTSVSKYTAAKTAVYLDYHKEIDTIYNGLNTDIQLKNVHKIKNRVIYAGSLVTNKGIYQLIKAWNSVHETVPDAILWVFGKGNIEKIKKLLNKDALSSVFFKGHVNRDELLKHLSESQLAIFPSYVECFSMAPMEAMACGTTVIYTKLASGPELIKNNENGILIDPDNVDEIADKIVFLLQNDEICNIMAVKGKERITKNFDISIIADKHAAYYELLLNKYSTEREN